MTLLMRCLGIAPRDSVWFREADAKHIRTLESRCGAFHRLYRVPADAVFHWDRASIPRDVLGLVSDDQPDPQAIYVRRWEA